MGHLRVAVSLCAVVSTLYSSPPLRLRPFDGGNYYATHKATIMNERYLKVRKAHRDYFPKSSPYAPPDTLPFVLLKGNWLENAGFNIGIPIRVEVEKQKLIITPIT